MLLKIFNKHVNFNENIYIKIKFGFNLEGVTFFSKKKDIN